MHAPLCGRFYLYSVDLACYIALIRAKSFTNCDAHLAKAFFEHALKKKRAENTDCTYAGEEQEG